MSVLIAVTDLFFSSKIDAASARSDASTRTTLMSRNVSAKMISGSSMKSAVTPLPGVNTI